MSRNSHSEGLRKLIHVAMAGFALLLRWIPWWAAAGMAAAALLFNLLVLPRFFGARLMRPGERHKVLRSGVAFYAFSVLVLILVFRRDLEVAVCAWGIMAFGDGAATLFGRGLGGPRLPWNTSKSWAGSLAFFVFGALGGGGLLLWVAERYPDPPSAPVALFLAACAALAGAFVESLPLELDDNLSVPLLSGAIVYSLQRVDPALATGAAGRYSGDFLVGLAVTCVLALAAKWAGSVSWSGVGGGVAVGTVIATFAGLRGFAVLALFFVLGSAATRMGYTFKSRRGIAQEDQGARGATHALANCSVPAYFAFLAAFTGPSLEGVLRVAFVASLATAACDTLGSEVGPLGRRDPFLVSRLRRVPAGTPGAISLLGTSAGAAGALVIGAAGFLMGIVPVWTIPLVTLAALGGALLESFLGATLEPRGMIGSETINFINTAAGGMAALVLARWCAGAGGL